MIRSIPDLGQHLTPGNFIYITGHDGVKVKGKITELTASELVIDVKGSSQRVEQHQIRQIDRHSNIIMHGFGIGLGTGVLNAACSDPPFEPCKNDPRSQCVVEDSKERLIFTEYSAVAGARASALIRRRDDPVYLAPGTETQRSRSSVLIMLVVNGNNSMPGFAISLRF